jgi:hypothetical protein
MAISARPFEGLAAAGGLVLVAALAVAGCSRQAGGAAAQPPGVVCLASLDPAKGMQACQDAVAAAPDDASVRTRLSLLRLKAGVLKAARQGFQVAKSQDPKGADAQFGLGLTLEALGQDGGNLEKLQAARRDPGVIDRFRAYGFSEADLKTFDTAPKVLRGPSLARIMSLTPKLALTGSLGVDVKCLVSQTGRLHDCNTITPLSAQEAPFGPAAERIVALSTVSPARNDGTPVADAPVLLTMVFEPPEKKG